MYRVKILCGGGPSSNLVCVRYVGGGPCLEKALAGFHHRMVRRMAGIVPERQLKGTWLYPPIGEALAAVLLYEIGVCIILYHNTVAKYIATCPNMDLCLAVERRPGIKLLWRWW